MSQAEQERLVLDTRILQKVNAAHRGAFLEKYPQQVEHILRLIAERLQTGLNKNHQDPLTNAEVDSLAHALYHINQVRITLKDD